MKERIGKYLDAEQWPALPGRVTSRWGIYSVSGKGLLGMVAWYGPWRQYTFDPEADTTYNVACLHDIAQFLAAQNAAHRQKVEAMERAI